AMRYAGDQALTARGTPVRPHHGGGGPGLVEEDQMRRIQLRLLALPGSARRGDIRPILLAGLERLFLRGQPKACKKRPMADRLTVMPSPVNCARNSSNVASGRSASKARTRASWAASANAFLPPIGAGATLPVRSQRCTSLIVQLTLTANCSAASRRELPPSTASTIRSRRSNDSGRGIHAGLLNPTRQLESRFAPPVNPSRFHYLGTCSSQGDALDGTERKLPPKAFNGRSKIPIDVSRARPHMVGVPLGHRPSM